MPASSQRHDRRRTQAERSTATIAKLIDATIEAITAVGFHRATASEICERAGVSYGALAHHFGSRIELVLTAVQSMTAQRVSAYVEFAAQQRARRDDPLELLRILGRLAGDDVAAVWAEITVAARANAKLRARVTPTIEARWATIRSAAEAFPGLAAMDASSRAVWLQILRGVFELSPLIEPLLPVDAGQAERRNQALVRLAEAFGAEFAQP